MKTNNEQYTIFARNIYLVLSKKFNLSLGEFSSQMLRNMAFNLGNRLKKISFVETNNLLNISRILDEIQQDKEISIDDLEEIKELFVYFDNIDINKKQKTSELEELFYKLSMRSKEAIINENEFDSFKEYMHIERPIEKEFERSLFEHLIVKNKSILFVVGNVGDGKSHILSYMKKKYPTTFSDYKIHIHNDATETDSPTLTALDTMKKVLLPFNDSNIENGKEERLIVAINLGVLTNLIQELKQIGDYNQVIKYVEKSNVMSSRNITNLDDHIIKILSFTEQSNFEIVNGEVKSDFYENVINKIYSQLDENPFYKAYCNDLQNGLQKLIHENYKFLLREDIQKTIVYLLTRAEVEFKIIISARLLFNFFYDITMPRNDNESYDSFLPYLIFENTSGSELLSAISTLDPIRRPTRKMDRISIEIYHAEETLIKVKELLGIEYATFRTIFQSFQTNQRQFDNFINTYLRVSFLINNKSDLFDDSLYYTYLNFFSNKVEMSIENQEMLFDIVSKAFFIWNGNSSIEDWIIKNPGKNRVKILEEVFLEGVNVEISGTNLSLIFEVDDDDFEVSIDFRIFELLNKLNNGYFLKEEDRQIATKFEFFVNSVVDTLGSGKRNLLIDMEKRKYYEIKKSGKKIKLTKSTRGY